MSVRSWLSTQTLGQTSGQTSGETAVELLHRPGRVWFVEERLVTLGITFDKPADEDGYAIETPPVPLPVWCEATPAHSCHRRET